MSRTFVVGEGAASAAQAPVTGEQGPQARRRAVARGRQTASTVLPAVPLLAFLLAFLVVPLGFVIHTAFSDPEIAETLPNTGLLLRDWSGDGAPPPTAYAALGRELELAKSSNRLRPLARRIGYELAGGMSLVLEAPRAFSGEFDRADPDAWKAQLIATDPRWGQPGIWTVLQRNHTRFSLFFLRWATGFKTSIDAEGRPQSDGAGYDFQGIFLRTVLISVAVTATTVLIGYPLAFVIANASGVPAALMMFLVLLPFWTSLLVRTMSWIVVLQRNGVANQLLQALTLASQPSTLLHTRAATILAMVQIQLPFTALPIISIMRAIPKSHVRAARSLGAGPVRAHATVYLPQTVPGIAAGALLTFVLCLGFYITPALVGGPSDQMVSFFIARFINEELNWGLASALSLVLLAGASILALPMVRYVSRHAAERS